MIDKKHIGRKFPPHTVEVEKGRLRFFAKAIGETNPVYTDEEAARAAGYQALPAPSTFAFCLEMDVPNPFAVFEALDINLGKVLHGEQQFTYYEPIFAGNSITFESTISDIYDKKDGALEFVVRDITATNQDGVRVADLRSVIVVRN